jgi:hypothetical protein
MDLAYMHKGSESPDREEEKKGSDLEKTTETLKKLIEEDEKGSRYFTITNTSRGPACLKYSLPNNPNSWGSILRWLFN